MASIVTSPSVGATPTTRRSLDPALLRDLLRSNRFLGHAPARTFRRETVVARGEHYGAYRITVATTRDEVMENFRLRHDSYSHHGYLNPEYDFGGLEYDADDREAALFLAHNQATGMLHGGARLVFDYVRHLPMDDYYSLDPLRKRLGESALLAEFSRLISHPTGQRQLNRTLIRAVFEFAIDSGVDYVVGAGRVDIRHYYDRWGFRDIERGIEFDMSDTDSPINPPMATYPHYMSVKEIRWDRI